MFKCRTVTIALLRHSVFWASFVIRPSSFHDPAAPQPGESDHSSFGLVVHFPFPIFCATLRRMRRAIYPGSFDPVTNGHVDIVERARKLFDQVIVAVADNDEKQPLFSLRERLDLLRRTVGEIDNVRIAQFKGLLVEFAKAEKAGAVIRGLRAVSDFEFEFQMALMNRKLDAVVETIFLMPKEEYTYLSSRIVKEIARLGGDVSSFVPAFVVKALNRKFDR
jgi:pantetheine-phosphate adenylyltransferase